MKKRLYLSIIMCANNLLVITVIIYTMLRITELRNGDALLGWVFFKFLMLLGGHFLRRVLSQRLDETR